jgi:hypothetical protein
MSTKTNTHTQCEYWALQEELEQRYGPGLAQEIIDQIKKADDPDDVPPYMTVKTLSEATEIFREDTRRKVKAVRRSKDVDKALTKNVISFGAERQMRELEHMLALYFHCQQTFYRLYRKALAAYIEEMPGQKRYQPTPYEPVISRAA